jgi:uncharacterized membrane protein
MAYCSKCGAPMQGQVCLRCGAPAGANPVVPFAKGGGSGIGALSVEAASAFCYLGGLLTGVLFLLLPPYNQDKRVRFNAFQSILLSLAVAVLHTGITIVSRMLGVISLGLGVGLSRLHGVVNLGFFVVSIYVMWKCVQGIKVMLPRIGQVAERQAGGKGSEPPAGNIGKVA